MTDALTLDGALKERPARSTTSGKQRKVEDEDDLNRVVPARKRLRTEGGREREWGEQVRTSRGRGGRGDKHVQDREERESHDRSPSGRTTAFVCLSKRPLVV
jgi:hypothetical protein